MKSQTIEAVRAIMNADESLSDEDKAAILGVCQHPAKKGDCSQNDRSPRFVTPKEAAEILKTSLNTVWRLAKQGRIRRVKLGHRSTRFPLEDIENLAS